jgi:predicted DNA-binding transcriptional regulator YafY
LTGAEVAAIAVALGADPNLPFAPDGRTALTKLLRTMSVAQREEVAAIANRVWVRTGGSARGTTNACVRIVDEAIRRGVALTIHYEDGAGTPSKRRIDPLAVARTGGRWYVLAWCYTRKAGRWFPFDRLRRATLTKMPVVPRSLVDVFGPPPGDAMPIALRLDRGNRW